MKIRSLLTVTALSISSIVLIAPSSVAALTCAEGGTCVLGDIGPGGGKVFFVKATGSFSKSRTVGSGMSSRTYSLSLTSGEQAALPFDYLEVAPTQSGSISFGSNGLITGGTSTLIGTGADNTSKIISTLSSDTTSNNSAYYADAYTNNSKSDWFLPSYDELLLIMILSLESDSGGPNIGSFPDGLWASTTNDITSAKYSARGQLSGDVTKAVSAKARAIRSFSVAPAGNGSDSDAGRKKRDEERAAAVKAAREKLRIALETNQPFSTSDLTAAELPLTSTNSLSAAYKELLEIRTSLTKPLDDATLATLKANKIMKFAVVERITGLSNQPVFAHQLVQYGVIDKAIQMKQLTTVQLMKLPVSQRDTLEKIEAFYMQASAQYEARKDRISAAIKKNQLR